MVVDIKNDDDSTSWAKPIVKENLSDIAYNALRNALMHGHLDPGDQLPLRPTSARFGISPTPMREALTRLVVERALILDNRGTVTVPKLTRDQLLEIRNIRIHLEGHCAARAAEIAKTSEIDALTTVHEKIAKSQKDLEYKNAVDFNTQFHLELCKMARQSLTYEIIEGLWVRCGPILTHLYDTGLPDNWDPHPHTRVIAALRARDPEAAKAAITYDIENGGKGLLDHVSK